MEYSNRVKLMSNFVLLALLVVGVQSQGPPIFTIPLTDLENVMEGTAAHLECRLIPIGDPTLQIEWFFNDSPLQLSDRFRTTNELGFVALDILYTYPEDTGTYTCKATNSLGETVTAATITVQPNDNP